MVRLTRRHFLQGAGLTVAGAVAGAGVARSSVFPLPSPASAATPTPSASAASSAPPDRTFVSTKLTTARMSVWSHGPIAPGLIFAGPFGHGANGVIVDDQGHPVWMEPTGAGVMDLRLQAYQGKQVLTYWTGKGIGGHGLGKGIIKDSAYRTVAEVNAGDGLQADLHEFHLTPKGTALLTAYPTTTHDLTALGGPSNGYIYDCHVQEVDIATGKVLFDWAASDSVPVTESYLKPSEDPNQDGSSPQKAFDPYHVNSIDIRPDGYLVSFRHTHTVYLLSPAGDIQWRLGGKASNFQLTPDAQFYWQHDVRQRPGGVISIFDNHHKDATTGTSRGLLLNVDEKNRKASVKLQLLNAGHRGNAMGNVQYLPNGNYFVGWGMDPAATEFTPEGKPVFEATGIGNASYRVYRYPWTATPDTLPDAAVIKGNGSSMNAYASWNGATEVRHWRFLTGPTPSSLTQALVVPRTGFETTAAIAQNAYFAAQALDADHKVLGTSQTLRT